MQEKGLSTILVVILVLVGVFAVGQIAYNFKLFPTNPTPTKQANVVTPSPVTDVTCETSRNFSLDYPDTVSKTYSKMYDNDPTCFLDLTSSHFHILIAPSGKFNEWGANGANVTKKPYSVSIGNQLVTSDEIESLHGQSSVVLEKVQGYDFGINFYDQDENSKKQVADILKTFKLTQ